MKLREQRWNYIIKLMKTGDLSIQKQIDDVEKKLNKLLGN